MRPGGGEVPNAEHGHPHGEQCEHPHGEQCEKWVRTARKEKNARRGGRYCTAARSIRRNWMRYRDRSGFGGADALPVAESASSLRDSPVNGTSASIARRMSGSRAGFLRLPRLPRPESGSLDGPPRPPEVAFFLCRRGVSPSPAASRLFRDPASGSSQRLWMSIVGSSSGDDWKTSRSS